MDCNRKEHKIEYYDFPGNYSLTFMARSRREQVISTGTIVPFLMWFSMSSPYSLPGLALSSRKRSPADKCT